MSVELFAVNAVVDHIAACPRLMPDVKVGDKTPITDGHIDLYSSDKKTNKTHEGRVPVQVKGRISGTKVKASRSTQSFPVEREVLQFFRNHGGGIFFYVRMRQGGVEREVFYANLLPFKVDRLLDGKPAAQESFSVKMTRLPKESANIEGIVRLAWNGRIQVSVSGGNAHLLDQAESLTVHSLVGFDETRPTHLALAETDYVVIAHLSGGLEVALDVDFDLVPGEYMERELAVPISCGGIEFTSGTGRRLDEETVLVQLSPGLQLTLRVDAGTIRTTLNLTREGSFRAQAKNFDFVLAAAAGKPLHIGESLNEPHAGDRRLEAEIRSIRLELSRLIELFEELGIDDDLTSQLQLDNDMRRTLLALHKGLVQDQPVQGESDGTGRYDISIGDHKIMVVVMPADDGGFRRIIDPFDPAKRKRFRIYRFIGDGTPELIDLGTVYESLSAEDMAAVLNLRLHHLVDAYAVLEDRAAAAAKANLILLRLLSAADLATNQSHRDALLRGATDLCEWLLKEEPGSLVHRVNWWQILHRRGELGDSDRRDIRAARRSLGRHEAQARELEACMLILLGDADELRLVLEELTESQVEKLHSWPVWALTEGVATATSALKP